MAVTRIKAYHTESSMHNGINYSADPDKSSLQNTPFSSQAVMEKTMAETSDNAHGDILPPFNHSTSDHIPESIRLSRAFSYTVNPEKTHINKDGHVDILVSGHHCNPDLAETDFKRCRGLYYMNGHRDRTTYAKAKRPMRAVLDEAGRPRYDDNGKMIYDEKAPIYRDSASGKVVYQEYKKKKEARTAYMWVMSFPGKKELGYEIDPRLIHEIGREFCREHLDDYACTVSTHVNTDHYHNHIMQCAYSLDGTHKYRDTMEALAKARDISDRLSIRFGIPIILSPQTDRSVSWFEWKKKHDGQSWKQQMRMDIREAVGIADSTADFRRLMEEIGYTVRETENHFTFTMTDAGQDDDGYRCRDSRLNSSDDNFDYSKTGIQAAISRRAKDLRAAQVQDRKEQDSPLSHKGNLRHHAAHIYISRYTIDGRRRTVLEILFIEALKIITLLRDLFQEKNPQSSHPVYLPYQKKLQLMEKSLAMVQKLGLEDREALSSMLSHTGIELSQLKKEYRSIEPVHQQEKEILDKIEEAMELIGVIHSFGLEASDLELYRYDEKEIRHAKAALMPMTSDQRRELYLALADSPSYRLRFKYEELTYREARDVITFLRKGDPKMPSVLFDISQKRENDRTNDNPHETAAERVEHDTWFLSRLSDHPLDMQMRIDRCRELLNELGGMGISPEGMVAAKKELQEVQTRFDDINRKINEANEKYRLLKHLEHNLMFAANPRFTHGPLFDDLAEKPIETKIVQNVNQLRPEDRADEEKHRFDFVDR